eukprot:m.242700 g.242700  ORF g.242700 m.242700 type:complete len:65 (+) comp26071_c0_seq1:838-1032(+)
MDGWVFSNAVCTCVDVLILLSLVAQALCVDDGVLCCFNWVLSLSLLHVDVCPVVSLFCACPLVI